MPGTPGDSLAFYGIRARSSPDRGRMASRSRWSHRDGAVFLQGMQYFRDRLHHPPREFVDKVDINSGAKTRVFEAAADSSESVVAPLDEDFSRVIVSRESPTQIANVYLRDSKTGAVDEAHGQQGLHARVHATPYANASS